MPGPYTLEWSRPFEKLKIGDGGCVHRPYWIGRGWAGSKYDNLEDACENARLHAQLSQRFVVYNVLDKEKNVIASFKGQI
jgi:hypothetical protein